MKKSDNSRSTSHRSFIKRFIIASVVASYLTMLSGCGLSQQAIKRSEWKPSQLQKKQFLQYVPENQDRLRIQAFLADRVRRVTTTSTRGLVAGGRAAALTSDGYFLTAHHVVNDGNPILYRGISEALSKLKEGEVRVFNSSETSELTRLKGRLVWSNPELDIAIVKFPIRIKNTFDQLNYGAMTGSLVFAGDDEGFLITKASKMQNFDPDKISDLKPRGDPPFLAAGEIKETIVVRGAIFNISDMISRGGMSGSPVVDTKGALCGIISRASSSSIFRPTVRTTSIMIPPEEIRGIIERDRKFVNKGN